MRKFYLLVALSLLGAGCKKSPSGPPPETPDKYGNPPSALMGVYERPGTPIRVDIMKTYNQEAGFSEAEVGMIKAALNTLTDEELTARDLHLIGSDYVPNQANPMMMYSNDNVRGVAIYFNQPKSSRTPDPNLGAKFLAYLGFPGRRVNLASTVYNEETHEQLFPEATTGLVPHSPDPNQPPGTLFSPQHLTVISPESPAHYVTVTSRAGHNALAGEVHTAAGTSKDLTADDQVRPHGVRGGK